VLHLSLRDIRPDALLEGVNVVDDADHVCREATSVDLAARLADFVRLEARSRGLGTYLVDFLPAIDDCPQ